MCGRLIIGDVDWPQYFEGMGILSVPGAPIQQSRNVAPTTINPIFLPQDGGLISGMALWG